MQLFQCGRYKTAKGSTMVITGKYCGISRVSFEWLKEDACIDCNVQAYAEDGFLVWDCDYCGGGRAELFEEHEPGEA